MTRGARARAWLTGQWKRVGPRPDVARIRWGAAWRFGPGAAAFLVVAATCRPMVGTYPVEADLGGAAADTGLGAVVGRRDGDAGCVGCGPGPGLRAWWLQMELAQRLSCQRSRRANWDCNDGAGDRCGDYTRVEQTPNRRHGRAGRKSIGMTSRLRRSGVCAVILVAVT